MTIMYSTKEAAQMMGITERRVRQLLKEGRLKGKKLSPHVWVVQATTYKRKRRPKQRKEEEMQEPNRESKQKQRPQSLRALARELGVSHNYLSQVKLGKRPASAKVGSRLQEIIGKQMGSRLGSRTTVGLTFEQEAPLRSLRILR